MRNLCCRETLARLRALYVTPLLWNHTLMPRILTCAFNEAILLHLLLLVALTCVQIASEIDHLAGCAGLHAGLTCLVLAKFSSLNYLFQVWRRSSRLEGDDLHRRS